jgi:hypothetical protein
VRALVGVVIIANALPAGAEVLHMRQVDATNLHIANQQGAIHWTEDIAIDVGLRVKASVDVIAKGTRSEHNLYVTNGASYNTDDTVTWTTTWRGTWKRANGALSLELVLDKDSCSAVRDEGGAKTAKPCKAAGKKAVLACTADRVDVETGAKKRAVAVWRCSPADGSELGESPSSWVFASEGKTDKQRCIEVHAGHMAQMTYAQCP